MGFASWASSAAALMTILAASDRTIKVASNNDKNFFML
jgi:hypothetical protein